MTRRIPIIPTIVVVAAAATMVALGVWQLGRAEEKEALIARYEAAAADDTPVVEDWDPLASTDLAYRRVSGECGPMEQPQLVAGRNANGRTGYVAAVPCFAFAGFDAGAAYVLVLGWTDRIENLQWEGGEFQGTVVPIAKSSVSVPGRNMVGNDAIPRLSYHIVADPPLAGLEANATPNPNDLPNNHLAYAGQWFFFALTALLIYGFALRRRWRDQA